MYTCNRKYYSFFWQCSWSATSPSTRVRLNSSHMIRPVRANPRGSLGQAGANNKTGGSAPNRPKFFLAEASRCPLTCDAYHMASPSLPHYYVELIREASFVTCQFELSFIFYPNFGAISSGHLLCRVVTNLSSCALDKSSPAINKYFLKVRFEPKHKKLSVGHGQILMPFDEFLFWFVTRVSLHGSEREKGKNRSLIFEIRSYWILTSFSFMFLHFSHLCFYNEKNGSKKEILKNKFINSFLHFTAVIKEHRQWDCRAWNKILPSGLS